MDDLMSYVNANVAWDREQLDSGITVFRMGEDFQVKDNETFKQILDMECGGSARIVIDMRKVKMLFSAQIGTFWSATQKQRKQGGDLVMFGLQPQVESALKSLGLLAALSIQPSEDEALASFGQ